MNAIFVASFKIMLLGLSSIIKVKIMVRCESEQQKTPKYMLISPKLNQFYQKTPIMQFNNVSFNYFSS
jgi:hypothetical protein